MDLATVPFEAILLVAMAVLARLVVLVLLLGLRLGRSVDEMRREGLLYRRLRTASRLSTCMASSPIAIA